MSLLNWKFFNPVNIQFGIGTRNELKQLINLGNYKFICSERGYNFLLKDKILNSLIINKENCIFVNNYPDITFVQNLINEINGEKLDSIVAFGGGSVIDVAKILSVSLSLSKENISIQDLISKKINFSQLEKTKLITIPTTFGTGSEVTPYATIWDFATKKKFSISDPKIFPEFSIIDPELGLTIPNQTILTTGLDSINQAAESLWNKNANPITMEFSIRSLSIGINVLPKLLKEHNDIELWNLMAESSLLSGLAISHTKTALCHSISYPLTSYFKVPHGLACAFTMPAVLNFCLKIDDGRFFRLARYMGIENNYKDKLKKIFLKLNQDLLVKESVLSLIPSHDELFKLTNEMFNPDRADNFMCEVTSNDIKLILEEST